MWCSVYSTIWDTVYTVQWQVWIYVDATLRSHITLTSRQQAAYRSCSGAFVSQSGRTAYRLRSPSPRPRTLTCKQTAIRIPGLLFDALNLRNPCNYMAYYWFAYPGGMEGWVGLVGWPIVDTLPTKWSPVNHRSGIGQGNSSSQRLTF